ncbi:MAG: hypothetical protein A2557_10415 [Candidatus Lambdaproteobacteria bacterium RIFOXYD2_FULL_56_26]|uniref:Uncharacterized protein n=1 Tax=Candidatus Lambdaproteobacteria bacterium RIFOXYD2_FULL_56_26 TaxID=1817773 RepID=A0A1F6GR69_9PROT|nr:MAG: hypothetical protein A2557_10415 [Candidatus Lambdaproteobacteria bacterium RIFOXYD2_FULL_56_26]
MYAKQQDRTHFCTVFHNQSRLHSALDQPLEVYQKGRLRVALVEQAQEDGLVQKMPGQMGPL